MDDLEAAAAARADAQTNAKVRRYRHVAVLFALSLIRDYRRRDPVPRVHPVRDLIAGARERWENTVSGLQDAMRVQAGVIGNIDTNRTQMSELIGRSQGASGALQAAQAGNQLLALQGQQLADLTAVVAANGRAQALAGAERAAAAEQGREQRRRFLESGSGYQPGNAQMFNGGN